MNAGATTDWLIYIINVCRQRIPWNEEKKEKQMELVANAMAYFHMSSAVSLQKQQIHERAPRLFFTPTNFAELSHMFCVIGSQINELESVSFVVIQNIDNQCVTDVLIRNVLRYVLGRLCNSQTDYVRRRFFIQPII